MNLGDIIKNSRIKLGLTQKDLAEGICTQALISKIEKGNVIPKKAILNKLEGRLGLEPNQLNHFREGSDQYTKITSLKNTIRKYLTMRDYVIIESFLKENKDLVDYVKDINDQAFFTWIKASIEDKIYHNKDLALEMLDNIPLDEIDNRLALEVINAMGVIYFKDDDYEEAINIFQNGLNLMNDKIQFKVQTKVLLNYCLALDKLKKYEDALSYLSDGIDLLVKNDSLYLLGDYHHAKGHIFYVLGNFDEAERNIEIAATIFELQNNNKLLSLSKLALTELNNIRKEG